MSEENKLVIDEGTKTGIMNIVTETITKFFSNKKTETVAEEGVKEEVKLPINKEDKELLDNVKKISEEMKAEQDRKIKAEKALLVEQYGYEEADLEIFDSVEKLNVLKKNIKKASEKEIDKATSSILSKENIAKKLKEDTTLKSVFTEIMNKVEDAEDNSNKMSPQAKVDAFFSNFIKK